ncbi:hypothetical protein An12g09210 [Aspergillus niger]|uniref:Uncharacterized protein n=2 Tax=Aspergillus niger TaxID=5061 RepID=A2R0N4_ASPNC|nr:hypothetical protein An12g09210 [Aspergillus niger]CAK41351.1 hypothetical protein An12g09210 [Aspergillus niger]
MSPAAPGQAQDVPPVILKGTIDNKLSYLTEPYQSLTRSNHSPSLAHPEPHPDGAILPVQPPPNPIPRRLINGNVVDRARPGAQAVSVPPLALPTVEGGDSELSLIPVISLSPFNILPDETRYGHNLPRLARQIESSRPSSADGLDPKRARINGARKPVSPPRIPFGSSRSAVLFIQSLTAFFAGDLLIAPFGSFSGNKTNVTVLYTVLLFCAFSTSFPPSFLDFFFF